MRGVLPVWARFNPIGTVVAVYFIVTGISGLQVLGLSDWVQQVFYGIALLFAVTIFQQTPIEWPRT